MDKGWIRMLCCVLGDLNYHFPNAFLSDLMPFVLSPHSTISPGLWGHFCCLSLTHALVPWVGELAHVWLPQGKCLLLSGRFLYCRFITVLNSRISQDDGWADGGKNLVMRITELGTCWGFKTHSVQEVQEPVLQGLLRVPWEALVDPRWEEERTTRWGSGPTGSTGAFPLYIGAFPLQ